MVRPVKLIQLRNPWGSSEWKGDWNDCNGAQKWAANPTLWQRVNPRCRNDGSFYMPFEEWAKIYGTLVICMAGGRKTEEPTEEENDDEEEEDEELG